MRQSHSHNQIMNDSTDEKWGLTQNGFYEVRQVNLSRTVKNVVQVKRKVSTKHGGAHKRSFCAFFLFLLSK